jgi:hypothetical protein
MPLASPQEFERLPLRIHTFLAGVPHLSFCPRVKTASMALNRIFHSRSAETKQPDMLTLFCRRRGNQFLEAGVLAERLKHWVQTE